MPALDSSYAAARLAAFVLAAVLIVLLAIMAWRAWQRSRVTPDERERRRRVWLVATGKMGDAVLVEIREDLVFYNYVVRGVEYTASQDISKLVGRVPADLSQMPSISVKYDPKNPANSIVVAEEWTGMRGQRVGSEPQS
jgi:hypothetical protein